MKEKKTEKEVSGGRKKRMRMVGRKQLRKDGRWEGVKGMEGKG